MADLRIPDLNLVLIAGRVVREPEVRSTTTMRVVARFTIAHNRRYKTKEGEPKEETTFVNVVAWDNQADYVQRYVRKGGPVLVEGRLRQDEWYDSASGQKRSRLEIVARSVKPLDWGPGTPDAFVPEDISPEESYENNMNHYPDAGSSDTSSRAKPRQEDEFYPEDDIPF